MDTSNGERGIYSMKIYDSIDSLPEHAIKAFQATMSLFNNLTNVQKAEMAETFLRCYNLAPSKTDKYKESCGM